MKNLIRLFAIGSFLIGFLAAPAHATSQNFASSGSINSTGSFLDHWTVQTSAATSISSNAWVQTYFPTGGGAVSIRLNGNIVLEYYLYGQYGYYANSGSVSGLAAGSYDITHGFNTMPNNADYSYSTTLSW